MQSILLLNSAPHGSVLRTMLASLRFRILDEVWEASALGAEVARLSPEIVVVCTSSLDDDLLDRLRHLFDTCPRPVIVFATDPSRAVIRKAIDAGVAAYVVEGWATERLTPIIEAACARFEAFESIRRALAAAQHKLAERKVIEKAKGIVMQQRGLTEDQAYGALRKMAMNQNLALAEVARRVISVSQLLA